MRPLHVNFVNFSRNVGSHTFSNDAWDENLTTEKVRVLL
jgi:hypothetical protein